MAPLFSLAPTHPGWQPLLETAIAELAPEYTNYLKENPDWLPGPNKVLNAFSLPLEKTRYILMGESPYPRADSANGYAFWDAAVGPIWSDSGLSKAVNRATSLRNFFKMLLLAAGELSDSSLSQTDIANLNHRQHVQTLDELFHKLLCEGFLLLNASLVLSAQPVKRDVKAWQPFLVSLLSQLSERRPDCQLILFGKLAQQLNQLKIKDKFTCFSCEHPYNLSFITNPEVLKFFRDFKLLALE